MGIKRRNKKNCVTKKQLLELTGLLKRKEKKAQRAPWAGILMFCAKEGGDGRLNRYAVDAVQCDYRKPACQR